MTTVSSCAGHASDAKELRLDRVAVVIDAENIVGRCLTAVPEAHLSEHFFSSCACTYVEDTSYSGVCLTKCAISFVAEECWELTLSIIFSLFVFIIVADIDVKERRVA